MVIMHWIFAIHRQQISCDIHNFVCQGEKWQNEDHLQHFCNKTVLSYQRVEYNETIILLNLAEYPLILAKLDLWNCQLSIRWCSAWFCMIIFDDSDQSHPIKLASFFNKAHGLTWSFFSDSASLSFWSWINAASILAIVDLSSSSAASLPL